MTFIYRAGHTFFRILGKVWLSYKVVNRENLVEDGPALVVCNHVSFLDPPMVGSSFSNPVYYLARKTLFRGPFKWLYDNWNSIPVDQEGPDFTSLKKIVALLKQGERVVLFPEGERSLDGSLGEVQAGVGLVLAKAKVPVLPLRIFGAHEAMPRGQKLPSRGKVTLVVGKPFEFSPEELAGKGREHYQKLADRVMEEIGRLELPEDRA